MITTAELLSVIPKPPNAVTQTIASVFAPAPEISLFVKNHFLNESSELYNPDHEHLQSANIGFLWTNVELMQKQKAVAAMATMPQVQGNKWMRGIFETQIETWFGDDSTLDFLIIIDARYAEISPASFCALVEHELYHCAQKIGKYGEPLFDDETNLPKFAIAGHDVEEFVGIMERYGVDACAGKSKEFVAAAKKKPLFTDVDVSAICGTCLGLKP